MSAEPPPSLAPSAAPRKSRSLVALGGLIWLVAQTLGTRTASILSQILLARLLSPATFGAVGLVYGLTTIASALANFGVDTVLLQRHKTLPLWISPGFWTSAGLGLVGFAVTAAAAPFAAALYHSADFVPLALTFAVSIPLAAMTTVPTVLLRTQLNFRFVAIYNVAEFTALQIATVVLAWRGCGAFSFVIPTPVLALVRLLVFCNVAPFSLKRRFKLRQLFYLIENGFSVFTTKFIIQVISQGDYFILGLTATKAEVGLYYFSFKLSTQTVWLLVGNISNVIQPMLVKFSGRVQEQVSVTWNICRLMAFAAIPACFLQAFEAQSVIKICFGNKWLGAWPIVAILSIALGADAITWITGSFLQARKEYRRNLIYNLALAPLFFGLAYIGAHEGRAYGVAAIGTAIGVGLYYIIFGPTMAGLALARYGVRWSAIFGLFLRPAALAAAACAIAATDRLLPWPDSLLIVQVVLECAVWAVAYAVLLWMFDRNVLLDLVGRFLPDRHALRVRRLLSPRASV